MAQWKLFTSLSLKFLIILSLSLSHPFGFGPTLTAAVAETEPTEKTAITFPTAKPVRAPTTALAGKEEEPRPKFPCKPPHYSSYPFCDTSLPIATRVQSLISLLSLDEKILQLSNHGGAVPRLGLPPYEWWSESLHGIATNGYGVSFHGTIPAATMFPQVLLTAASFNRSLWSAIAAAIAVEGRAMYNAGQAGLTFWAPNINVFRDPRWGRGQETPGEDPAVTAAFAVDYVKAFQGESGDWGYDAELGEKIALKGDSGNQRLMLSACCKHYTAYDLESWGNLSRYTFNAEVSKQDMEDTYQPPFRSCVEEGHASCLMCSYNQVNGVPACARGDLLQKARNVWGFDGYVTSDCDAVAIIYENQSYTSSPEEAVADVLKAGMDIDCGTYLLQYTRSAVEKGKVKEKDIDRALFNLFSVQMRLGLYDGDPENHQFGKLGPQNVCSKEHRELALEAARQGIVLLKNDKKFLPLKKEMVRSLAVIGPVANDTGGVLGGGYSGVACSPINFFDGSRAYVHKTVFAAGCPDVACNSEDGFEEAINAAKNADVVVLVAGLDLSQEGEEHDRESLLLPGKQTDLVLAVAHASKRPIILILTGGGPVDVSFAKDNPSISSILWVGYPGEMGGQAVAEIIFGDFNPGGRLPVTWYPHSFTQVPMSDMRMRADNSNGYPGRTYRFYTGEVVFGFGHGLSYSGYSYKFLSAPDRIRLSTLDGRRFAYERSDKLGHIFVEDVSSCSKMRFSVQISVFNEGEMDGSHVIMLFSKASTKLKGAPLKQLIGFKRIHIVSKKATTTSISIDPCKQFSVVNDAGLRVLPLGTHFLMLGGVEHPILVQT